MNRLTLLLVLLVAAFSCDDNEKPTTKPSLRDATLEMDAANNSESDLDVEYYDFDTISIEPDLDLGPDIDDESE